MRQVRLCDRANLPAKPGIYWAVCGEEILYIGKAKDQTLRERWSGKGHFKLSPLLNYQRRSNRIVYLKYKSFPKWRVSHEEAVAIEQFEKEHGDIPPYNQRREKRIWWIDLLDSIEAYLTGFLAAAFAMCVYWRFFS